MKRRRERSRAVVRTSRPKPRRWALPVAIAAVVAGSVTWWMTHRAPAPIDRAARERAVADSLLVAIKAQDAERMFYWLARRRELDPHDPERTIDYALQLHDLVWAGSGGPHQMYRTSLERVETDLRVIAMLDTAGRAATNDREGGRVEGLLGSEFYDYGLTTDALILLHSAYQKVRDDTTLKAHLGIAITSLRDPLATADSKIEP